MLHLTRDIVISVFLHCSALHDRDHGVVIHSLANAMLRHAVTLTFDPLTLNFYSASSVMYVNSVQNLSEIE